MVEATLENAMGVAFFLFFLVLGLNYLNSPKPDLAELSSTPMTTHYT